MTNCFAVRPSTRLWPHNRLRLANRGVLNSQKSAADVPLKNPRLDLPYPFSATGFTIVDRRPKVTSSATEFSRVYIVILRNPAIS